MKFLKLTKHLGEVVQPIGHFVCGCLPCGYRTTEDAAMILGITQLEVWELMNCGALTYMSSEFTYAVKVLDLEHLLMVDRVERHSKELAEWGIK